MKSWTKQDLILLYYGELEPIEQQSIKKALAQSQSLQTQYTELCDFLDLSAKTTIPEPSCNLNQRIMANIYQQEANSKAANLKNNKQSDENKQSSARSSWTFSKLSRYLGLTNLHRGAFASLIVMVSIFYVGRWSALPNETSVANHTSVNAEQNSQSQSVTEHQEDNHFTQQTSHRILLASVSNHLQASDRLFTQVSNGSGSLAKDLGSRRQMLEDLIALNRLYRRAAEKSGDTQLANILQHLEPILLTLSHAPIDASESDRQEIRQRLNDTDLLFKLRVTNKKIDRQLI